VQTIRGRGANAEFMNIGFSTGVFCPEGEKRLFTPEVVFLGNNYPDRFPRSSQRARIVANLRDRYRERFAVHGTGWGERDYWLSEEEEAAAYRVCKIALNINHYDLVPKFTSDRLFRCMGSGAFCISNYYPGIEEDFEIGNHLVVYRDEAEIPLLIDKYLADDETRKAIASAGCRHVHANHTWDNRMDQIKGFLSKYRKAAAL
jgi:spore maturation protein CgeB